MRNTLITIAAWSAAIALVLWQRAIWPGLKTFLPGLEDLIADLRAAGHTTTAEPAPIPAPEPVIPTAQPAQLETYVIERKPAAPKPAPKRAARPAPKRAAQPAGFAV